MQKYTISFELYNYCSRQAISRRTQIYDYGMILIMKQNLKLGGVFRLLRLEYNVSYLQSTC